MLSGPSGLERPLCRQVLAQVDGLFSVSVTTRPQSPPRPTAWIITSLTTRLLTWSLNELLEHAEVFGRHRYGTPRPSKLKLQPDGWSSLTSMCKAQQIRTTLPQALMLFIEPPDEGDLEARLRNRGRDEEDAIARRLAEARKERLFAHESGIYDGFVVNANLEAAASEILRHIHAHRG